MIQHATIRPIGLVPGPQSEHGNAIRLAGGMVYASRFAVVLRRDGRVVERWLALARAHCGNADAVMAAPAERCSR